MSILSARSLLKHMALTHEISKTIQNYLKLAIFPKIRNLRLRPHYVVLRRILRVITGCLWGFYGLSMVYGFFMGCPRVETRFLASWVKPVLNGSKWRKLQSKFCWNFVEFGRLDLAHPKKAN